MIKKALLATTLIVSGAAVHYFIPQTDVVRIVGVETKRVDLDGTQSGQGVPVTRDVYFLQTEGVDDADPMVYRNDDNLLYAKWNSADVQSRGQSLAANKDTVAVSHYGWRVPLFSAFPNALSVKPVDASHSTTPYAFLTILTLTWGAILFGVFNLRKMGRARSERRAERASASASSARSSRSRSGSSSVLDDFLGDSDSSSTGGGGFSGGGGDFGGGD
jgi:hypothetical protein